MIQDFDVGRFGKDLGPREVVGNWEILHSVELALCHHEFGCDEMRLAQRIMGRDETFGEEDEVVLKKGSQLTGVGGLFSLATSNLGASQSASFNCPPSSVTKVPYLPSTYLDVP